MRILTIQLENLNSLIGKWKIDLTHPDYNADGLFAITGPTGAGKSTILDAICLALYGSTPRLGTISKSDNEILSRQAGMCSAEVTFKTARGEFRCWWGQQRARKKATGVLQQPQHEIHNAQTGKLLQTGKKNVAKLVEEVTGLDFDRFTRSMLLAQGSFAAFLSAKSDERSELLEQITGTEIYSKISLEVHRRKGVEQTVLDSLETALHATPPLDTAQEKNYRDSLKEKSTEEIRLGKSINDINSALRWLDKISELEKEAHHIVDQKQELNKRITSFAPEKEKLERAYKALKIDGIYATLRTLREEQKKECDMLDHYTKQQPLHETNYTVVQKRENEATEELQTARNILEKAAPIFKQVREFDLKIGEKNAPIQSKIRHLEKLENELTLLHKQHSDDTAALTITERRLSALQMLLKETSADELLVTEFTGIEKRVEEFKELLNKNISLKNELSSLNDRVTTATNQLNNVKHSLIQKKNTCETLSCAFDKKNNEQSQLLDGKDIAVVRTEFNTEKERLRLLEEGLKKHESLNENDQRTAQLMQEHSNLSVSKDIKVKQLETLSDKSMQLEREIKLLEQNALLQKTIKDFDEARKVHLHEGEACPLCGSFEHPWADTTTPVIDNYAGDLEKQNQAYTECMNEQTECKIDLAKIESKIEQIAEQLTELKQRNKKDKAELTELLIKCAINPDLDDYSYALEQEYQTSRKNIDSKNRLLSDAEKSALEMATLRDTLQHAKDSLALDERSLLQATHEYDNAINARTQKSSEISFVTGKCTEVINTLSQETSSFSTDVWSADTINHILEELRSRRNTWIDNNKECNVLEKEKARISQQLEHITSAIEKTVSDRSAQKNDLDLLKNEQRELIEKRQALFTDKNCDNEEERLNAAVKKSEKLVEHIKKEAAQVQETLNAVIHQISNLNMSIKKREDNIHKEESSFLTSLEKYGFMNEDDFLSARLTDNQRETLSDRADSLSKEMTILTQREQTNNEQLSSERKKELSVTPREILIAEHTVLLENHKQLQQEIGAIQQKLSDNDALKIKLHKKLDEIELQKKVCNRWNQLHQLIGSNDGKKFRNFAQGLTFESMVRHANRELQKMSSRYLLLRDDSSPLDINVCDNWQAGEIRSTKNLSGGESFIVSLSLALGLAKMASEKIRVDSLFLDEGFGTLDDEALEIALDTLSGLHQDGKLIGVISHVPALKERIATQIEVIPLNNGNSKLTGPGCLKLTENE